MTERDELITKWLDAMLRLQTAKDAEADLRKRVVETLFPEHKDEGTETVELGNGFKISAEFKLNFKIEKDKMDAVVDEITEKFEKLGVETVEEVLRYKPEISASAYRKAPEGIKKLLNKALVITPGTPSVKFVQPNRR